MKQSNRTDMYSWMHSDLQLGDHPLGKGIYATAPISKGTRLAVFGGHVMTLDQEAQLPVAIRDYAHQIDDDLVIGINETAQEQTVDHFNHSCSPNAGFKGQIFLVAMRDVASGEEVTFDYAMVLAEASGGEAEPYILECKCGAQSCRGRITDHDWRDAKLQEKYAGYFQYYIQEKINLLRKS